MDSVKSALKKTTNTKPKTYSANTSPSTRQSIKDSAPKEKPSPALTKRGPKRKSQVPIDSNVKRSCLRSNNEKTKPQTTKKLKDKLITKSGEDSSDDTFTEEEDEETTLDEMDDEESASVKNDVSAKSQLNGEKDTVFYTSPRVRKPNPKFQDFITSPKVRSTPNVEKQVKEKVETPRIKMKQKVKTAPAAPLEKDPLDIVNMRPAQDGKEDEIVRSFLPILDKPKVLYDSDEDAFRMLKSGKPKLSSSSKEENIPVEKGPEAEEDSEKSNIESKTDISNDTVTSTELTPAVDTANTITPVIITPQIVTENSTTADVPVSSEPSTNEPKVKNNATNNSTFQKKTNNHNVRKNARAPVERKRKNMLTELKKKEDVSYCLIESEGVSYRTKSPKASDVDFNKLVRTLKSVKLPASNWKIRIVVSRQQTITEVTFTNKEANERCVKFSRVFTGYVITFGKSVVKLIGAPNKISSFNDVTILLDIIHNLSLNDPILQYVADKDK